MSTCNTAFTVLCSYVDSLLSTNFMISPVGDKTRVGTLANYLINLLTNSLESVAWVNTRYYISNNQNVNIDLNN